MVCFWVVPLCNLFLETNRTKVVPGVRTRTLHTRKAVDLTPNATDSMRRRGAPGDAGSNLGFRNHRFEDNLGRRARDCRLMACTNAHHASCMVAPGPTYELLMVHIGSSSFQCASGARICGRHTAVFLGAFCSPRGAFCSRKGAFCFRKKHFAP